MVEAEPADTESRERHISRHICRGLARYRARLRKCKATQESLQYPIIAIILLYKMQFCLELNLFSEKGLLRLGAGGSGGNRLNAYRGREKRDLLTVLSIVPLQPRSHAATRRSLIFEVLGPWQASAVNHVYTATQPHSHTAIQL